MTGPDPWPLARRALRELNQSFALLSDPKHEHVRPLTTLRDDILPKLFDLREIWLRVMTECRDEHERPSDDDDE